MHKYLQGKDLSLGHKEFTRKYLSAEEQPWNNKSPNKNVCSKQWKIISLILCTYIQAGRRVCLKERPEF